MKYRNWSYLAGTFHTVQWGLWAIFTHHIKNKQWLWPFATNSSAMFNCTSPTKIARPPPIIQRCLAAPKNHDTWSQRSRRFPHFHALSIWSRLKSPITRGDLDIPALPCNDCTSPSSSESESPSHNMRDNLWTCLVQYSVGRLRNVLYLPPTPVFIQKMLR